MYYILIIKIMEGSFFEKVIIRMLADAYIKTDDVIWIISLLQRDIDGKFNTASEF